MVPKTIFTGRSTESERLSDAGLRRLLKGSPHCVVLVSDEHRCGRLHQKKCLRAGEQNFRDRWCEFGDAV